MVRCRAKGTGEVKFRVDVQSGDVRRQIHGASAVQRPPVAIDRARPVKSSWPFV